MPENWQIAGFGLYIHWPFCAAKCPYCDFNSHVAAHIDADRWKRAYLSEIARIGSETGDRVLSTVFFGGGTPSLMNPDTVADIMDAVRNTWTTANDFEATLEANPTSVEAGRFAAYRQASINRVSVGVQALNDNDLKALGRLHTVKEAMSALDVAHANFDRVSFDLIYARQHQTLAEWRAELRAALELSPSHLSMYQLTIEQGTAFGDRFRRGKLPGLPDEDLGADLFLLTQEICDAAGLSAYEVSNHARPGHECRHNLMYWRSGDYAGIGPGAHGRLSFQDRRYSTETELAPGRWIESVEASGTGELSRQILSEEDRDLELLLMGLRTVEGVDPRRLSKRHRVDLRNESLLDLEYIKLDSDRIFVTPRGRPVLNAIIQELVRQT
ncbi:MAG: radical SAM family heme chaperone HemW [Rhodobacter sp.]|nr:radical SAM family heme chaperone HemW [Rhodobacter sp.]